MKKLILLSILLISALSTQAQEDDKFTRTMKSILSYLDTAQTKSTYQKSANKLERIAEAEKDEWLAYYWAAYCNVMLMNYEEDQDKGKQLLDKTDVFLLKADSLSPNNSEIYVLRGWWYSSQMRFGGSPMKYGPLSGQAMDKAIELDGNNPRAYTMKAIGVFYTPSAFGGGKDKAKPIFETALKKFETFLPASEIHPDWGEEFTLEMYKKCDETEEKKGK